MTWFSTSTTSTATVTAARSDVWAALTDPDLLARLTPFLKKIEVDGDKWTWHLAKVPLLGKSFSPVFTEQMTFRQPERIDFTHVAPAGSDETAGTEGHYDLRDAGEGRTRLAIELGIEADLKMPKAAGPAVRAGMKTVVAGMGRTFSKRLLDHLGARQV